MGCATGFLAAASDFPVTQLIRSDVQDSYNPENRYGVAYGAFQTANPWRGKQEVGTSSTISPAGTRMTDSNTMLLQPASSGLESISFPTSNTPSRQVQKVQTEQAPIATGGQPQVSVSSVSTTAILNGWTPEATQQQVSPATPTPTRVPSLQLLASYTLPTLISSFGTSSTGNSNAVISSLVLNPLQIGTASPSLQPNLQTLPPVTTTTPNGNIYVLGTSPTTVQTVHPTVPGPAPAVSDSGLGLNLGTTTTPEPSTIFLALAGLAAGIAAKRRS